MPRIYSAVALNVTEKYKKIPRNRDFFFERYYFCVVIKQICRHRPSAFKTGFFESDFYEKILHKDVKKIDSVCLKQKRKIQFNPEKYGFYL